MNVLFAAEADLRQSNQLARGCFFMLDIRVCFSLMFLRSVIA